MVDGSAFTVGEATAVGLASVGAGTTVGVGATVGAGGTRLPQAARQNPATRAAISKAEKRFILFPSFQGSELVENRFISQSKYIGGMPENLLSSGKVFHKPVGQFLTGHMDRSFLAGREGRKCGQHRNMILEFNSSRYKKENNMSQLRRRFPRSITIAILLAFCGVSLVGLVVGGCIVSQPANPLEPTLTAAIPTLTEASSTSTPPTASGDDTLTILKNNRVPAGDWRDEAIRLKGIPDIPEVVSTTPANYALGDSTDFYVINADTRESRKLSAQLVYETQNVYFFVEKGVQVNDSDVKSLVDEFQNKTYPTNREFFGSEWIPGVDGDPRLYMLYARGIGKHTQAYSDSVSEFSHLAHPYSNEKEIIVLNADAGPLNDPYWRPTLAHEFQHMIHWYQNRNAETWLNEGASMLAQSINGFDAGTKMSFLNGPDLQLNAWADLSSSLE